MRNELMQVPGGDFPIRKESIKVKCCILGRKMGIITVLLFNRCHLYASAMGELSKCRQDKKPSVKLTNQVLGFQRKFLKEMGFFFLAQCIALDSGVMSTIVSRFAWELRRNNRYDRKEVQKDISVKLYKNAMDQKKPS